MMNFEIRQKFNNFVKVIENKEKEEWLKQNNNHIKYVPDLLLFNPDVIVPTDNIGNQNKIDQELNCECEISQGYSSFEKSNKSENNGNLFKKDNILVENISVSSQESFKINYINNKDYLANKKKYIDDMSLLEDDYVLDQIENKQKTDVESIKSEIKNKFKIIF